MRETASQQRCPTTDVKGAEAEKLLYCDHLSLTIQATKASFAFGSGLFLLANVLPKLSWSLNLCLHPDL